MLKVDLRELERKRRLSIEGAVPADAPLWQGSEVELAEPLQVRLDAQFAGRDVLVRGEVWGQAELPCRRCLRSVSVPFREEVAFLYRPGLTEVEAEDAEVYALPERTDELDLSEAVREQVVLSMPQYAVCDADCRGLCPRCGVNLNQGQCSCGSAEVDDRWAALRKLRTE